VEHLGPNDPRLGTEGLRLNDPAAGEVVARSDEINIVNYLSDKHRSAA
jgi:hypothetical protein